MRIEVLQIEPVHPYIWLFETIMNQEYEAQLDTVSMIAAYCDHNDEDFDIEEWAIAVYISHRQFRKDAIRQLVMLEEERNAKERKET